MAETVRLQTGDLNRAYQVPEARGRPFSDVWILVQQALHRVKDHPHPVQRERLCSRETGEKRHYWPLGIQTPSLVFAAGGVGGGGGGGEGCC